MQRVCPVKRGQAKRSGLAPKLCIGSLNIGTLMGKSLELVDVSKRLNGRG